MIGLIRKARAGQEGYALLAVIGIGTVMILIVSAALSVALSGTQKANTDTTWNSALAAAYAGVEDYKSRVQNDVRYTKYGNPAAPFTAAAPAPPTGVNLNSKLVNDPSNKAFGIGATGTWATVPGSSGVAQFRYAVSVQKYAGTGVIQIQSTGKVGKSTRSIVAELKQGGLSRFVYFTDYETQDPQFRNNDTSCVKYRWMSRDASNCDIQFYGNGSATSDIIDGAVDSNDQLVVCGAKFNADVTGAANAPAGTPVTVTPSGCGTAGTYASTPTHSEYEHLVDSTVAMKAETTLNDSSAVPNPGCLYTGPTTIHLEGANMRVWSPFTKYTQVKLNASGVAATADVGSDLNPAQCGSPTALASKDGALIPILLDNLVYVQAVPGTGDVNYTATNTQPTNLTGCNVAANNATATWSFVTNYAQPGVTDKTIRHPLTNEVGVSPTNLYDCRNGDVYVSGQMTGRMTIAAYRYTFVTGDITYASPAQDLLGLVGQGGIVVWNPMKTSGATVAPILTDSAAGRTIDAVLTSNLHTLQVQNYSQGGMRGTLHIYGSIAQEYRGPVGTSGSPGNGYLKHYEYDPKLVYLNPPKYAVSTTAVFDVTQSAGVPAAYRSDGVAR